MQLLIAGTPGCLFDFVCGLLIRTTGTASIVHRHCNPDETWIADTGTAEEPNYILTTNYPSWSILKAVREGKLPAIIVIDTSHRCFMNLRQAGHDAAGIARQLSASAAILGELSDSPAALRLGPDARQNPVATLQAILDHASWPYPADSSDNSNQDDPIATVLSANDEALICGVIHPAFHFAATGERRKFTWPRARLLWGDHPDQPAPAILELAGPARVIVYGPYFHIPTGYWIAQAQFAFSPAACSATLALEFHGTSQLARCKLQVEHAGIFRMELPLHITSARETIELRLVLENGAIEGHLGLDDIQIIPIDP